MATQPATGMPLGDGTAAYEAYAAAVRLNRDADLVCPSGLAAVFAGGRAEEA